MKGGEMDRYGYPWPASRLGSQEMEILCQMREILSKPITECLKLAVQRIRIEDLKREVLDFNKINK